MDGMFGSGTGQNGILALAFAKEIRDFDKEPLTEAEKEKMHNAYLDGDRSDEVLAAMNKYF